MRHTLLLCLMVATVLSQSQWPTVPSMTELQKQFDAIEQAVKDGNMATFLKLKNVENWEDDLKVLKIMESYKGLKFIPVTGRYVKRRLIISILGEYSIKGGNLKEEKVYSLLLHPDSMSPTGWKAYSMSSDDQ